MAGLDDINSSDPAGTETPTLGDNRIRALAAKIIEAFDIEHALAGPHTFLVGSAAQRPAAGYEGRFYILAAAGVAVELQYDTGTAWATLTSNQAGQGYAADLAAHIAANPIDHPNESVTQIKIAQGAVLKKHLDSSGDMTTLENLVNGGNADSFHVHSMTDQNIAIFTSSGTWSCPDGITIVECELWSAGGGGGGVGVWQFSSGGGGSGGYMKKVLSVVAASDYVITIGLGGNGGASSNSTAGNGLAGGSSSFAALAVCSGGGGGISGWSTGLGGSGGSHPGYPGAAGRRGMSAQSGGTYGYGGPGGSPPAYGGGGGLGGIGTNIAGFNGNGYGSGGGGSSGSNEGGGGVGGNGAQGLVVLKW